MTPRRYIASVGFIAALVGLILLFVPVKGTSPDGVSIACGSVADPDQRGAALRDAYRGTTGAGAACADSLDTRQVWVIVLIAAGVVVGIGALTVRLSSTSTTRSPATDATEISPDQ